MFRPVPAAPVGPVMDGPVAPVGPVMDGPVAPVGPVMEAPVGPVAPVAPAGAANSTQCVKSFFGNTVERYGDDPSSIHIEVVVIEPVENT